MTLNDLEPKNKGLEWIFRDSRLLHTFRGRIAPKSLEIFQDNLRMKLSPLRSPTYKGIKFGCPFENARFLLLSTNLARERLQIDRHAAYHNNHCWRPFRGCQHWWPWTTLTSENRGLSEFFAISGCDAHLKSEFLSKLLLEIDQDNLRMKLNWCSRVSHKHWLGFLVLISWRQSVLTFCLDVYWMTTTHSDDTCF